jgi:hypothetical protein
MTYWRATLAIALLTVALAFGACGDGSEDEDRTPTTQLPTQGPKLTATPYAEVVPTPAKDTNDGWLTYENDELGYAIDYPPGTEISEGVSTDTFSLQRGGGTTFSLPVAEGTNLSDKELKISARTGDLATCDPPEAADKDHTDIETVTYGNTVFHTTTSPMAASSHLWDVTTYWTSRSRTCVIIDFVLLSVSPGAIAGPTRPYLDKNVESAILPAALATFRWLE